MIALIIYTNILVRCSFKFHCYSDFHLFTQLYTLNSYTSLRLNNNMLGHNIHCSVPTKPLNFFLCYSLFSFFFLQLSVIIFSFYEIYSAYKILFLNITLAYLHKYFINIIWGCYVEINFSINYFCKTI